MSTRRRSSRFAQGNLIGLASFGTFAKLQDLITGQRWFAAFVHTRLLCYRNALALALFDQAALKLRERTHNGQEQVAHRRVFTCERQALLGELDVQVDRGGGLLIGPVCVERAFDW